MIILLTAFEPFGGATVNGSEAASRLLAERDERIHLVVLLVVRGEAEGKALEALAALPAPPVFFLSLGEKKMEPPGIHLEKVAINWDDFRLPDNLGNQPCDTPIREDGPAAYFATAPVKQIVSALSGQTPVPVSVSLSAGAYLCNHLAYCMLDVLAEHPGSSLYAFAHVPAWRPDQGEEALVRVVDTLQLIVDTALAGAGGS